MACNDIYYMNVALEQARLARLKGEVPVGAVLVSGTGKILSRAYNRPIGLNDPTAHAEILALRDGGALLGNYRLTDATLYVTLEPCVMCAGAMVLARIKRLVFAASDPKAGACGSVFNIPDCNRLNHRVAVTKGILAGESRALLQAFFRERRGNRPFA